MGPEQNIIDVDPVNKLVIDAVVVISRKGTRENRKAAYSKQLENLRPGENDDSYTKTSKLGAVMILSGMEEQLLHGPEPSGPSLELHRGSRQMAKDPAGDR